MKKQLIRGLVVLRAPAGCGKSTFAQRIARQIGDLNVVVSSDAIRAQLCGDAADQTRNAEVFALVHQQVSVRLRAGLPVIVDATNLRPAEVEPMIRAAQAAGQPSFVVDCTVDLEVALGRNATRDRVVPEDAVRRQFGIYHRFGPDAFGAIGVEHYLGVDQVLAMAPLGVRGPWMTGPFDVIGDVHGQAGTLTDLRERLGYGEDWAHPEGRIAVFVGDLVDKGPDPVGVADEVLAAWRAGRVLVVKGNHERKLARVLAGIEAEVDGPATRRAALLRHAETAKFGLRMTLCQLAEDPRVETGFGPLIRALSELPHHLVLDGGRLVVVHAAIRPDQVGVDRYDTGKARRLAETWQLYGPSLGVSPDSGLPVRVDWVPDWTGPATVVRGHVVVPTPGIRNRVVSVDTGAGDGVALTAFSWPEQEFTTVKVRSLIPV